jgi:hypothetical protein
VRGEECSFERGWVRGEGGGVRGEG